MTKETVAYLIVHIFILETKSLSNFIAFYFYEMRFRIFDGNSGPTVLIYLGGLVYGDSIMYLRLGME